MIDGRVFQQIIAIPMYTTFTPHPVDFFLYSYEVDFTDGHPMKTK
jgi:hypothetical protein